jgi:hypothetical protein
LRNSRLNIIASHKEGVFQIIGPTKRGIEKGVADGIVAAIRRPRAQGIGPKPPRLKRGDAARVLKVCSPTMSGSTTA